MREQAKRIKELEGDLSVARLRLEAREATYVSERIEELEAHLREARSQLAWCNSQYGPDASTNTVLVALDRTLAR